MIGTNLINVLLLSACLFMSVNGDHISGGMDGCEPNLVNGDLHHGYLNQTHYYEDASRELGTTYRPGDFSKGKLSSDGLLRLSNGLSCKRIAKAGQKVKFANGKTSNQRFHMMPDGAAVFPKANGGWYYVSNAEVDKLGDTWQHGGVGRIEFDKNGKVIGYKKIANHMKKNW